MVEDKVEHFCQYMAAKAAQQDRGQMCIAFMDRKQKRNMLGFVKTENVVWEEWVIGVKLMPMRSDAGLFLLSSPVLPCPVSAGLATDIATVRLECLDTLCTLECAVVLAGALDFLSLRGPTIHMPL